MIELRCVFAPPSYTRIAAMPKALCGCSSVLMLPLHSAPGSLAQLRPEYTYFTVYIMDKGLEHMSNVVIPPSLDLLVFSCDATMRSLRTVPLPMLKQASQIAQSKAARHTMP